MKKLLLLTLFSVCILHLSSTAQVMIWSGTTYPKKYKMKKPIQIRDLNGAPIRNEMTNKLKYLGEMNDKVIVNYLGTNTSVYKWEFEENRRAVTFTPVGGVVTMPFKYWMQSGNFEPTLSLSGLGGLHMTLDKDTANSLNILAGIGMSSVTLKKSNTDPSANITDVKTVTAATLSFTLLYQFKSLQIGATVGWDNDLSNSDDKWLNQGAPWLSFAIGYKVFASGK